MKHINFIVLLVLCITLANCSNVSNDLKEINNEDFVYEKVVALKKNGIEVDESRLEQINNIKYIVEERIVYDSLGIFKIYDGSSEGFITYTRNSRDGRRIIRSKMYGNKVLLDRKHNHILDGTDTIKMFEIFISEKIIVAKSSQKDRIIVYKFK
ncbi:hypothetical protein EQP59_02215 [Ornithobacterium rhinotracheale]|uniref:Lipoprotein n=1 Tax=Ornithobacterium rhinotracheale TaxID=28251 RepID=A0A3R5XSQ9_ORNRH|nr:hypothetical protein [Ornithobacterium rhinotracheale]QAR30255.1 hypothetical protein EQP59_02215 [Ornithobacterium rhinotracheale]